MNERLTKTFYITIDADDLHIERASTADGAYALSKEYALDAPTYGPTPFRVDITEDEDGKPHFGFTELEEPKVEYWGRRDRVNEIIPLVSAARAGSFHTVYIKDDEGNLILLSPEEKAKVIEEWKNS